MSNEFLFNNFNLTNDEIESILKQMDKCKWQFWWGFETRYLL